MTRRRAFSTRAVGLAGGEAALGDGDQPLDERPQLLRLRHGRLEVLVAEQRRRLVPQHRDAMLGDAAQLAVCDSVSHGCNPVGLGARDQGWNELRPSESA